MKLNELDECRIEYLISRSFLKLILNLLLAASILGLLIVNYFLCNITDTTSSPIFVVEGNMVRNGIIKDASGINKMGSTTLLLPQNF